MTGGAAPVVHLYCLCWNDAAIIPHFLRHYDGLVSKFFVHDNRSTDGSVALLTAHPRVTVTSFDVPGQSFVMEEQRLSETMWLDSRAEADWVILIDLDEFLFHPAFSAYLRDCTAKGITAIRAVGYDMVCGALPTGDEKLCQSVTAGVRSLGYDKLCLFDPKAITQTRFGLGRHNALPEGRVKAPDRPEVALLHYKHLGIDYSQRRNRQLGTGLKALDLQMGWGNHYLRSDSQVAADFETLRAAASVVPGLPGGPPAIMLGLAEHVIRSSGLFDPAWYLARFQDVAMAAVDPVAHFHNYGWREGRAPNPGPDWVRFVRARGCVGPVTSNPYMRYFTGVPVAAE